MENLIGSVVSKNLTDKYKYLQPNKILVISIKVKKSTIIQNIPINRSNGLKLKGLMLY